MVDRRSSLILVFGNLLLSNVPRWDASPFVRERLGIYWWLSILPSTSSMALFTLKLVSSVFSSWPPRKGMCFCR